MLKHTVYRNHFKFKYDNNKNINNINRSRLSNRDSKKSILSEKISSMHIIIKNNNTIRFTYDIFGLNMAYKLSWDGNTIIKVLGMIFAFD